MGLSLGLGRLLWFVDRRNCHWATANGGRAGYPNQGVWLGGGPCGISMGTLRIARISCRGGQNGPKKAERSPAGRFGHIGGGPRVPMSSDREFTHPCHYPGSEAAPPSLPATSLRYFTHSFSKSALPKPRIWLNCATSKSSCWPPMGLKFTASPVGHSLCSGRALLLYGSVKSPLGRHGVFYYD